MLCPSTCISGRACDCFNAGALNIHSCFCWVSFFLECVHIYTQFLCQKNFEQIIQKGLFESLKALQSFFFSPINRVTIQNEKVFLAEGWGSFPLQVF